MELTLIKDSEISPYFIWTKLYTQLHLAFVEKKDDNQQIPYGVSFPEYRVVKKNDKEVISLGSKLRVFGNSLDDLHALDLEKWLLRLTDYVHIKSANAVGSATQCLTVNRYRPQASPERLARRYAKRHSVTMSDALNRLNGYEQAMVNYPYIQLKSLSGGDIFSLYINQQVVETPVLGTFSAYGLSEKTTVPHW
jgi:CRISPR-associated endonuclease Csy4